MKIYLQIIIFLICALSFADDTDGGYVGNGGNVLVCKKSNIEKIESYDRYEGRTKYGWQADLGPDSLSVNEKVQLALVRLIRLDKYRADLYTNWIQDILNEKDALFLENTELIPVPDNGIGNIPNNCELKQVAQQRKPLFPFEKRYTFNKDLWDLMDNDAKADILIHEVILKDLSLIENQTTSTRARYFNQLIISNYIQNLTPTDYIKTVSLTGLNFVKINGVFINTSKLGQDYLDWWENGELKSALAFNLKEFKNTYCIQSNTYNMANKYVGFNKDGSINSLNIYTTDKNFIYKTEFLDLSLRFNLRYELNIEKHNVEFYPDTTLIKKMWWEGSTDTNASPQYIKGPNFYFDNAYYGILELFPSGKLKRFDTYNVPGIPPNMYFGLFYYKGKTLKLFNYLELNENGDIVKACILNKEDYDGPTNSLGCIL